LTHVQFCRARRIWIHSFRHWLYRRRPASPSADPPRAADSLSRTVVPARSARPPSSHCRSGPPPRLPERRSDEHPASCRRSGAKISGGKILDHSAATRFTATKRPILTIGALTKPQSCGIIDLGGRGVRNGGPENVVECTPRVGRMRPGGKCRGPKTRGNRG
jgi:hypothetical protein